MPSDHILDLAAFVSASPTSYHAAVDVALRLEAGGFVRQREQDPWDASPGGHYALRDGAVIAWRIPAAWRPEDGFRIVGAHTDSPGLKLKPNPVLRSSGWTQLGVEVYGGPLLLTWIDRELGLAGRITTRGGTVHLVRTGPLLRVPHLAPHLDRTLADHVQLDRQQHLQPVFTAGDAPDLAALLLTAAGVPDAELAGYDVFCHVVQPPATFGPDDQFLASGRLDNLSSVHAGLRALLNGASAGRAISVFAAFDHEEVGSATRSGAQGPFLSDVLHRTATALGTSVDERHRAMAASSCVSADAGHAVHPNYAGHHDPGNRPLPNQGPLLKLNASQRYASDAIGSSIWYRACHAADVPVQEFVSNNAVPCGSTIGPITAARLGITTVDVGIPLLSMHSAREMCGVEDPPWLARALAAYWAGA
jgi:aspartyl aminopeptidase